MSYGLLVVNWSLLVKLNVGKEFVLNILCFDVCKVINLVSLNSFLVG